MAFSNILLGLNLMYSLICLHRAKVYNKTKMIDLIKKFCSLG